eukprot:RCo029457
MSNDTKYLLHHNVPRLIDTLLGQILAAKPDNPLKFLGECVESELRIQEEKLRKDSTAAGAEILGEVQGKFTYLFSAQQTEGTAEMKALLGYKGASLAEMAQLGCPVPPGFTISTRVCRTYHKGGKQIPAEVRAEVEAQVKRLEQLTGKKFGDPANPLLLSVRSGAAVCLPGLPAAVLNVGLTEAAVGGLAKQSNARFAWDCYRRLTEHFGTVVKGIRRELYQRNLCAVKRRKGLTLDLGMDEDDMKAVALANAQTFAEATGGGFPQDPWAQLWATVEVILGAWGTPEVTQHRRALKLTELLGTAVTVQAMVFGNLQGDGSATGLCFSRNPTTGENHLTGEWLPGAQGDDVVGGIRTTQQIRKLDSQEWAQQLGIPEEIRSRDFPSLEEAQPSLFAELTRLKGVLERRFTDVLEMRFTVEAGKLSLLQVQPAQRSLEAQFRCAVEMVGEGLLSDTAALRQLSLTPAMLLPSLG